MVINKWQAGKYFFHVCSILEESSFQTSLVSYGGVTLSRVPLFSDVVIFLKNKQCSRVCFYSPCFLKPYMNSVCNRLYESMQEELGECRKLALPALVEIETCHAITFDYWNLLRQKLGGYTFHDAGDEIRFYKVWKPRFVSEIIFYELMNHLELFRPETNRSYRNLLLREKTRLEKFAWNNSAFFEYYKSGDCSNDAIYFLPVNRQKGLELSSYDQDEKRSTNGDYLAAQLIALERYDALLKNKLLELQNKNNP